MSAANEDLETGVLRTQKRCRELPLEDYFIYHTKY